MQDAVSPAYWYRRVVNRDEYLSAQRILAHGNFDRPEIALTFDDGPHDLICSDLLDVLKQHHVKATFFMVGARMAERPELVRRMVAEGHEVGNHTMHHYRLDTLKPAQVRKELEDADDVFYKITGRRMSLMRPPGVRFNGPVIDVARKLDQQIITWDVAAKDFLPETPAFIVNAVLRGIEPGSIILMHQDYPSTVTALPRIIAGAERDGYRFVTVPEMMAHMRHPVAVRTTAGPPHPPAG